MKTNPIYEVTAQAYAKGKRLVAPLVGFPGLNITHSSIKLAQQNYEEHIKVIHALVREFQPDVQFPLMDLSVEANALGQYTVFPVDDSATVEQQVSFSYDDIERLKNISIVADSRAQSYITTVKVMKETLPPSVLVGCYVTGPYTLVGLLLGADAAATNTILHPELMHAFCSLATEKIATYAREMVRAGADLVCVLEPSGVMLGPEQFDEFSARYVQHIHEEIGYDIPVVYHVCGNSMHLIPVMCSAGVQALSIDSAEAGVDIQIVAESIPKDIVIIGNLNPTGAILTGTPEDVRTAVHNLLHVMKPFPNYILSTGCDLPKQVPIENIRAFMNAGRE